MNEETLTLLISSAIGLIVGVVIVTTIHTIRYRAFVKKLRREQIEEFDRHVAQLEKRSIQRQKDREWRELAREVNRQSRRK